MLVSPAMTLWGACQNMRLRSETQRWAEELDEMIEAVHRRHEDGDALALAARELAQEPREQCNCLRGRLIVIASELS